MTTKFISDMGPKSALIAPRPLIEFNPGGIISYFSTFLYMINCTKNSARNSFDEVQQTDTSLCHKQISLKEMRNDRREKNIETTRLHLLQAQ